METKRTPRNTEANTVDAYTAAGAAAILGVTDTRVRQMIRHKQLDRLYLTGGRAILVTAASVERELQRRAGDAQ